MVQTYYIVIDKKVRDSVMSCVNFGYVCGFSFRGNFGSECAFRKLGMDLISVRGSFKYECEFS